MRRKNKEWNKGGSCAKMCTTGKVLLSFDVEEFDFPRERGKEISLAEGVTVSAEGLERILKVLDKTEVKATFFVTGNFAKVRPDLVKKIIASGHEVGAHGVDHFRPRKEDIAQAKKMIEKIAKQKVVGWRQPRMMAIDYDELTRRGYKYDSSVNPAFIPGRYNHFDIPRSPYKIETKGGKILEIPASVATIMRVPLFWLALHLFPFGFYLRLAISNLRKTGYFATYFHPWEFADLEKYVVVPKYIKHNGGSKLECRLERLILELKKRDYEFLGYSDFYDEMKSVD